MSDFVIENGVLTKYQGPGGDVVIPEGVTVIGDGAFLFCEALTSATIPASVTHIGENAFSGCIRLADIVIPDSVVSIGPQAFFGCDALADELLYIRARRVFMHPKPPANLLNRYEILG